MPMIFATATGIIATAMLFMIPVFIVTVMRPVTSRMICRFANRQPNLPIISNSQNLDRYFVTDRQNVMNILNVAVRNLTNVHQPGLVVA